jgi:putative membrane protein insertion efficiency factor
VKALRRASWWIGAPARAVLIGGIRLYQHTLSGAFGDHCRFYPSCSHYAADAIHTYGAARGSAMAVWRVLRCQPFGRGGFEPVPPKPRHRSEYDEVIQGVEEARS